MSHPDPQMSFQILRTAKIFLTRHLGMSYCTCIMLGYMHKTNKISAYICTAIYTLLSSSIYIKPWHSYAFLYAECIFYKALGLCLIMYTLYARSLYITRSTILFKLLHDVYCCVFTFITYPQPYL